MSRRSAHPSRPRWPVWTSDPGRGLRDRPDARDLRRHRDDPHRRGRPDRSSPSLDRGRRQGPFVAAPRRPVVSFPPPTGSRRLVGHRAEIAQLVEHATENRGVASSNLALCTTSWWMERSGGSGSVGRASPCQGEGRGFESRLPLHSSFRTAAPSSSGRTADFGSVNRGSNPRGAASHVADRRNDLATW